MACQEALAVFGRLPGLGGCRQAVLREATGLHAASPKAWACPWASRAESVRRAARGRLLWEVAREPRAAARLVHALHRLLPEHRAAAGA